MNYPLNFNYQMGNVSYYPDYDQYNYIYTELNNVNQKLFQFLSIIQRGMYDEYFNPNGYNGCIAMTHNLNEWGNGQGMKNGRVNDREFHFLLGYKKCLENLLIRFQQDFYYTPYNNNLLW